MENTTILSDIARSQIESELVLLNGRVQALTEKLRQLDEQNLQGSTTIEHQRLDLEDYERYGRQMILSSVGKEGQLKLRNSSVLIVGAGGLGCPALMYLAGAGIGRIRIVDHDVVSKSNLHRQILYREEDVGIPKVYAAANNLESRNQKIQYEPVHERLTSDNVFRLIEGFDLVLDCTDTPMSRYLLGDATRIENIPLVSASALRLEAQITVFNVDEKFPCYRCLFPQPPKMIDTCQDAGILGPVVGFSGTLQAIESIKILLEASHETPKMIIYDALHEKPCRTVRIRGRQASCAVCSASPTITKESITSGTFSYIEFCGGFSSTYPNISESQMIDVFDLQKVLYGEQSEDSSHLLIDVRDRTQYAICHLPPSKNFPINELVNNNRISTDLESALSQYASIYVICRLGNDSRTATKWLIDNYKATNVFHVKGGLDAWTSSIDPAFPRY
ncbi:hypothetical protein V1511DRAFT_502138 [Dipodascopsis uninucleata]